MSDQPPKPHAPISKAWRIHSFIPHGIAWVKEISLQRPHGPGRIKNKEMDRIKAEWGIQSWEEDNHEPGNARKFWLPVEIELRGVECPCKDEEVIVDGDYQYSIKKPLIGERKLES